MGDIDQGASPGRVHVVREGEAAVVHAAGEFDLHNSPALWTAIATVLGASTLLVDLAEVTFMDSSCLSILVRAAAAQDEQGQLFSLRNPSASASRLLAVTGLDALVSEPENPSD
jgi:anti-anti-sigma factor